MQKIKNITVIGSGNVATHLCKHLFDAKYKIDCIYSRDINKAKLLAKSVNANAVDDIAGLPAKSDLFLMAISDNAIDIVAKQLNKYLGRKINVVHTSGMVSSAIFRDYFDNYGVFYPLQTFTKNRDLDISKVPFCITANNKKLEKNLSVLANKISTNINIINDKERMKLHVAAVFVNNFTNFMFIIGKDITEKENLNFELLFPLIEETTAKILEGYNQKNIQTGPAIRSDKNTIKEHLKYLEKFPKYMKVYKTLTQLLMK